MIYMPVVGFNFNKMNIEKRSALKGKVNIKNNISIKKVEPKDLSLGKSSEAGLSFVFEFTSKYEPNFAEVFLGGDVVFIEDAKKIKEILSAWKKDKKVPEDIMAQILNTALNKCNVKALVLSDDLNLPPPIPLPKIESKK